MTGLRFPKPTPRPKQPRTRLARTPMPSPKRWGIKARRPRRLTPRDPELVSLFEALTDAGGDFSTKTRATADTGYVSWIHTQPCAFARYIPGHRCSGNRIVMCHEAKKPGVSLKCSDSLAFPGCDGGHGEWTAASGEFKTWKKAQRRAFADEAGPAEYARYLSSGSRRAA